MGKRIHQFSLHVVTFFLSSDTLLNCQLLKKSSISLPSLYFSLFWRIFSLPIIFFSLFLLSKHCICLVWRSSFISIASFQCSFHFPLWSNGGPSSLYAYKNFQKPLRASNVLSTSLHFSSPFVALAISLPYRRLSRRFHHWEFIYRVSS